MKKIFLITLTVIMLSMSATSAFAWSDEDFLGDLNIPLQVPDFTLASGFSVDDSIADHDGITGNVYRGMVSVEKQGKETLMVTLGNYKFNEGKYRISLWFMEEGNSADPMTRMIRPKVGNDTIKNGSTYLFFVDKKNGMTRDRWIQATLDFTVDSSNNQYCLNTSSVGLWWNCASSWDGDKYEDRNHNADYYVCFSDVKLYKYPGEALSMSNTNSGDTMKAAESAFKAYFTLPIDKDSDMDITIDGVKRSSKDLNIIAERNTTGNSLFSVSPKGGFVPGKKYNVEISGVRDIFGRKYDEKISGNIASQEYLIVKKTDETDEQITINVENNMSSDADFVVVLFWYSGDNVKYTKYSQNFNGVKPGESVDAHIAVPTGTEGMKIKAHVWNTASFMPMPFSLEQEI